MRVHELVAREVVADTAVAFAVTFSFGSSVTRRSSRQQHKTATQRKVPSSSIACHGRTRKTLENGCSRSPSAHSVDELAEEVQQEVSTLAELDVEEWLKAQGISA